ncbi:MAG: Wzz/FepE/Etk N-terminal domain-containing protein [Bacteroidia bacterium]|nr:Wzz/FepE/Etk N-terminal domain-containing protein [Bacteroidia bacterium]
MITENTKPSAPTADNEIDLIALAKTFWSGRRTVLISILIFGILGFLIAISSSKEFVATTIMVPSGSDGTSKLGGLGGLAAMAGININTTSGSDLSPTVYPQIVSSLPYQLELMNTPLNISELSEPVTFFDYYSKIQKPNILLKYTIGLPGIILGLPGAILKAIKGEEPEKIITNGKNKPLEMSDKQRGVRLILSGLVSLETNPKEGTLILSAKMPEARAAAQLGQRAQELLQQYITEFKIKKAKTNLDFIQQRYDETAQKFEAAQQKLAMFSDRNKNVSLATAKTEEDRLTRQYNLIYGIYSELAKQVEQAKIQVKQDTPVFTIIEPISVPTIRSKPNRTMILFFWLFLGGLLGTGIVFGKEFIGPIKKKWNEAGTKG